MKNAFKEYGIAFGEAVLSFQTPPNQSQIRGGGNRHRPAESGFGGWADEKMENNPRSGSIIELGKIWSTTFDNILT